MIPYFDQPELQLGPLTIHAFGALVAIGVLVGTEILRRRAKRLGLDVLLSSQLVTWVLVCAFAGAHLVDRFVYFPRETLADPWSVVRVWQGLSSFGGFLGAVVGAWLFARKGILGARMWSHLDIVSYAFPFGWIFGRTGCFVAFDHPGLETSFFLSEMFRDGKVRHNLGLDEALYTILIAAVMYAVGGKPRRPGFFVALLPALYAPFRFFLDFLRHVDVRYFGLTPGQYGSAVLLVVSVLLLRGRVGPVVPGTPGVAADPAGPARSAGSAGPAH